MWYHTRQIKSERVAQLKAAALKYNAQTDSAPVVKAKGAGAIAEKIIQTAREHKEREEVKVVASILWNAAGRPL